MKFKQWLITRKTDDKSVILLLIKSYFLLTFLCFLFLILPFSQNANNSIVDHIFFSVSIASTTGLAPTVFSDSYNLFGQIMSLFFIQLGGIGYMSISSFIILKQFDRLPTISARLLKFEFNLPKGYPLLSFIYSVFIFTILIESVGTVFLYYGFVKEGVNNPLWNAIFHSISAFCTAGFSLFSDSMSSFHDNHLITNTILILSLLGSIGFIVLFDFWLRLIGRRKYLTLTTKIILFSTFSFWIVGGVSIFLSDLDLIQSGISGFGISIFQSISAHTTVGFNNYPLAEISQAGSLIIVILMIIGASPAGTGGGIKTTSITAIIAVLTSILKRRKRITFLNREIPSLNIYLALASSFFYALVLIIGIWLILLVDSKNFTFLQILFEVASALSTVGLSTGITGELSDLSKLILSSLMFIGRLGVLTFGLVLVSKSPQLRSKLEIEDIAI